MVNVVKASSPPDPRESFPTWSSELDQLGDLGDKVEEANNEHEIAGPRISSLNFSMKLVVCREQQIYTHPSSQAVVPGDCVGWQPCFLSSYRKVHSLSVGENVACHLQMGQLWLSLGLCHSAGTGTHRPCHAKTGARLPHSL